MISELIHVFKEVKSSIISMRDDVYPIKSWFDDYIDTGNIVPPQDKSYDLGSENKKWSKIFVGKMENLEVRGSPPNISGETGVYLDDGTNTDSGESALGVTVDGGATWNYMD